MRGNFYFFKNKRKLLYLSWLVNTKLQILSDKKGSIKSGLIFFWQNNSLN